MKIIFWLPMLILNQIVAIIPRAVFIRQYEKSSVEYAEVENEVRNKIRLMSYKMKRGLKNGN